MKAAIYPGSFDPITNGHMDIIRRAASMFDQVLVAVMINPGKTGLFTPDERVEMIQEAIRGMENVRVIACAGLLADLAREEKINILVKGVRTTMDLESELAMAFANKQLNPTLDTVLLPTSAETAHISSTLVREISLFHGDISAFVPTCVVPKMQQRFK